MPSEIAFVETLLKWWQLDSHLIAISLFLRLVGLIYVIAFISILVQVKGLFGKHGILPVRDYLALLKRLGVERFYYIPTLFWINSSDEALVGICFLGTLMGGLLAIGFLPLLMLILLWICYLSFKSIGQDFLNFQWDALLLEVGFVSILVAAAGPSSLGVILLWFLLFKFMFMAGFVKITSHDRSWRDLTALSYHYETQPLPHRFSWYAHQLPLWFQKLTTVSTLFLEILVPFLVFGPSELRLAAFALLAILQLMIILTGNYGPFNLLSLVMLVPLLNDTVLQPFAMVSLIPFPFLPQLLFTIIALGLMLLNSIHLLTLFSSKIPGQSILHFFGPIEISNPYGIFAVMTTKRYEILVDWSNDGKKWYEYEFKWKPQNPAEAPPISMPHMPRLDWLMWFLPFNPYDSTPWFLKFLGKLLENSPDVLSLLRNGPKDPPLYVRALVYEYRFTDWKTRQKTGNWWKVKFIGSYTPIASRTYSVT